MTEDRESTKTPTIRREDLYGRPIKAQTYELLVTTADKVKERSKEFKVTAAELMEALMEHTDWNAMAPHLMAIRAKKEQTRAANKEARKVEVDPQVVALAKQIKNLTPETLAEIQALISTKS